MLTINQAIDQLLQKVSPLSSTESVPLLAAVGRILATDQISTVDVPPANNSAMDGYAINIDDLSISDSLPISQTIAAGHPAQALQAQTAARIFTGAEIPNGANAVVMQEHCTVIEENNSAARVQLPKPVNRHNNIRMRGQDIKSGDCILNQGRELRAQDIGLLASVGINNVIVYKKPTVTILSSGDELVEPGKTLGPAQIYNSNRYLLRGFLEKMQLNVLDLGVIADNMDATLAALQTASTADIIISTGGVSVGDEDHIKQAVQQLGAIDFWRIAIKPGKPVAFGQVRGTPFIGLPGNPASVFITFLLLARPLLLTLNNQHYAPFKSKPLIANFSWRENSKRQEYLRAKINNKGSVDIYPNQSSGILTSTVWASGLVVVPAQKAINHGDTIDYIAFDDVPL